MSYPTSDNTIHSEIDPPLLVKYGDNKLGFAIGSLSEPADNGNPAGYIVLSFDKTDKFALWASFVTIIDKKSRQSEINEYLARQKLKKAEDLTAARKPKKTHEVPVMGLAEILATADVGQHDTALSYATELVKYTRAKFGIDFSVPDNFAELWDRFFNWAVENNKPFTGIDPTNLMDRIEGELFYITEDKRLKHAPYGGDGRDEAAAIEAGYKKPQRVNDLSTVTPEPLAPEYVGKYAYHTTSFVNLFVIAASGLLRNMGGTPGGSCYLAEDVDQRDDSIAHSKQVIAAAFGRFALKTYVSQREDRADKVVDDDDTARDAQESELQSDLDEHAALLRFKVTAEQKWVTDPQDSRALLLCNTDVAPQELDCLTSDGWVPVTGLAELGRALHYDDGHGGPEFQVFVRQSERVLWRLAHDPTDNDILEGQAFVERGRGLLGKLSADSTPYAQVEVIINDLREKLSTL
jgi:hypothetical protein